MERTQQTVSPMSNAGRNTYVREHLSSAMLELLAEKPLGEISVSELCGRAGVGRTSFYRNFETKEEIVKGHIHRLLFTELATAAEHQPLDRLIPLVFSHFRAHEGFYRLLGERGWFICSRRCFSPCAVMRPPSQSWRPMPPPLPRTACTGGLRCGFSGGCGNLPRSWRSCSAGRGPGEGLSHRCRGFYFLWVYCQCSWKSPCGCGILYTALTGIRTSGLWAVYRSLAKDEPNCPKSAVYGAQHHPASERQVFGLCTCTAGLTPEYPKKIEL